MMTVEVSIVTPFHNAEVYLDEALAGIASQTFAPNQLELCLVDDASQDQSRAIAERWIESLGQRGMRTQLIVSPHSHPRGVGWATNIGVCHATGRYFFF